MVRYSRGGDAQPGITVTEEIMPSRRRLFNPARSNSVFSCFSLLLAAVATSGQAQTVADLFNDTVLHEVRITMSPADWQTLKAKYLLDDYYPCDFQWRDIVVKNCACRSRGWGSRDPRKPGIHIDINRTVRGQRFLDQV